VPTRSRHDGGSVHAKAPPDCVSDGARCHVSHLDSRSRCTTASDLSTTPRVQHASRRRDFAPASPCFAARSA
jgi:hypothetical protein